jgi:hypothetical protein
MERPDVDAAHLRAALMWLEKVDAALAQAEAVTAIARAADAPLAERIGLWVEITDLRRRVQGERLARHMIIAGDPTQTSRQG